MNIKILLLVGYFCIGFFTAYSHQPTATKQMSPKEIFDFCGEKIPIEDIDVRERIDRELIINTNLHSATTLVIKRANKIFPIIEPILKKNNIPDDFKYLCVIESALTTPTSPAGAKGYWQFMAATAKEYNLEISETIDERNHITKSTEAACKYLNSAYQKFKNWTLVAAAYNRGISGIEKQLNLQGVSSYYDLHLNEETSRYVFRIIALKTIMKQPEKYGYYISDSSKYQQPKTKTITVNSSIENLYEWAKQQNTTYKMVRYLNPWILDSRLITLPGKSYEIEIEE